MTKTNLVTTFFRARLFERLNRNYKLVFTWDFGQFSTFADFYNTVKKSTIIADDCYIEFYVCKVGESMEFPLESIKIPVNCKEVLNYEHPKRRIVSNKSVDSHVENRG